MCMCIFKHAYLSSRLAALDVCTVVIMHEGRLHTVEGFLTLRILYTELRIWTW